MLTAGLVLAVMVLPFITSISRDVFDAVPPVLKEAAYGIGCTTWEVVRYVVLPYTRVGVIGGVMLGLGRALGETMAVTFVIGNAHKVSASLLGLGWLVVILFVLLWEGFSGLSLAVFTEMTPPPGADGGLLNPIVGSLILTVLAVVIGTPIGMLAGTYMAEYGRYDRLTSVVRF